MWAVSQAVSRTTMRRSKTPAEPLGEGEAHQQDVFAGRRLHVHADHGVAAVLALPEGVDAAEEFGLALAHAARDGDEDGAPLRHGVGGDDQFGRLVGVGHVDVGAGGGGRVHGHGRDRAHLDERRGAPAAAAGRQRERHERRQRQSAARSRAHGPSVAARARRSRAGRGRIRPR